MKIIREFLLGKYHATEFMHEYMHNNELHEFIQGLIPKEAIDDENHVYWKKCIMRGGLECYHFNVREMLYSHCGFGENEEDQREIFHTIRALYLWVNPNQKCTNMYDDKIDFFLDLEQACFGGPEVTHIVKSIANEFIAMRPKSARKKAARERVDAVFHVAGKNRPRWIQGPLWPMGKTSPMEFLGQKRSGNSVYYEFRDVSDHTTKVVRQFY